MPNALTSEELTIVNEVYAKWIAIGLCTDKANRKNAEAGIADVYRFAGMPPPKEIVWFNSPRTMIDFVEPKYPKRYNNRLLLETSAEYSAGMAINLTDWKYVPSQLDSRLRNQLRYRITNSVKAITINALDVNVPRLNQVNYGQHDADSLAQFEFFNRIGLVRETNHLSGFWTVAENAGWWFPAPDICYVCERHDIVKLDEEGRLHCEDDYALIYPDGWGMYAWHGVHVSEDIILHPDKITTDSIEAEKNTSVRWAMIERYGIEHYLYDSNARCLTEDQYGKLWVKASGGREPFVFVEVKNSTPEPDGTYKTYFLRVPPFMRSAHQAVAWTFGLRESEYNPLQET